MIRFDIGQKGFKKQHLARLVTGGNDQGRMRFAAWRTMKIAID